MASKKAEARERVKAMREEQARKDRRRERMLRFTIAGGVLAAVVIIAVAVTASRSGNDNVPSSVNEGGNGIVVGKDDAPVTIDYWMDFLCPHCQDFEETNAETLTELADSGDAKIVYHPVTYTGGQYSELANNAFACSADEGKADEFLNAAFEYATANAPAQWTNDELVQIGEDAGVGGDFASCVRDGTYDGWSSKVEDAARDEGDVEGTPTVKVNGELLEDTQWTPDGIRSAVEEAAS